MMAVSKPFRTADALDLPPAFKLITVREAGDAFRHATRLPEKAAGTLVWARRFQLAEFAVVLEPAEPLAEARSRVFCGDERARRHAGRPLSSGKAGCV